MEDIPLIKNFREPLIKIDMKFFRDLMSSDVKWAICAIAMEIGLFNLLKDGGVSFQEIANKLRTDEIVTRIVLDLLAGFGMISKRGELYYPSPFSKMKMLYGKYYGEEAVKYSPFWKRLIQILKGKTLDPLRPVHEWSSVEEQRKSAIVALCGEFQKTLEYLEKEKVFNSAKTLLDIGGGHGFYSIGFCSLYPELRCTVFDLPNVIKLTERNIRKYNMEDRIELIPGDALKDPIPSSYDIVFMSDVTFRFNEAREVVKKIYQALNEGGILVIKDIVPCKDWSEAPYALTHEIAQLIIAGSSKAYGGLPPTMCEYSGLLKQLGFYQTKILGEITPGWTSIMLGYK